MKLQCDVCGVEQASVLCCADEAVLCSGCDARIHSANKLAGKHRRFSLLQNPSTRPLPLCDICKEKNGFLFCQEDRAILCRECDVPIHTATVHTSRHSRFLLTGIRLCPTPMIPPSIPISHSPLSENKVVSNSNSRTEEIEVVARRALPSKLKDGGGSTISDYLMKLLPGWRVDDFLFEDPSAADNDAGAGFSQVYVDEAPLVATVPWFTPASLNAATAAAAQPLQWRPVLSSEDVSTVPQLSQFYCDYTNNSSKRSRTLL
ncbi:B-box zinc finger protein 20 [Platanthera guangdongensis]|uniref:B-box zinc finger protein 20 n=1 Tax=Platanthera guangdongensis TaxID=2320717 RepID=A0ABR2LPV1_9ASPA